MPAKAITLPWTPRLADSPSPGNSLQLPCKFPAKHRLCAFQAPRAATWVNKDSRNSLQKSLLAPCSRARFADFGQNFDTFGLDRYNSLLFFPALGNFRAGPAQNCL